MSRRRRSHPDSLELLLDTMCNTFGGIIMIALLIALLSRAASTRGSAQVQTDALRRQLARAEQQAADAQKLRQSLRSETADPNVQNAFQLLTQRDELRKEIERNHQMVQSNANAFASLPLAEDPVELDRLAAEKKNQTNQITTLTEQLQRDAQLRQRQLRLPREHVTGKKTFYFIVRYGKIYPVHLMNEGARELNNQTLEWRETASGESAIPRRDAGIESVTGLPFFARMFNEIPSQTFSIHFLVYNDSFPGFLAARQIPLGRGYDVGWEFLTEDRPVIFSSRGEAPPAL